MANKKKNNGPLFEDNIDEINRLISINVSKWTLKGLAHIDKDDIASIIRIHVYNKFHLYNPSKPLGNWLSTVIKNQLKNLLRNFYYKFSSPCLDCPAYMGNNECKIFGEVSAECKLYESWLKNKHQQYSIELPLTLSDINHENEVNSKPDENINFDEQILELKSKLSKILSSNDFQIFEMFYLENKTEAEIIKALKFKNKTDGLKQIKLLKNSILPIVKNIISKDFQD